MEEDLPRKLAAILYADVAGYSRLTGEDEDGTHRLLRSYLAQITSSIESHQGRVVHYAGDAVLADFGTVIDAMNCAIHIQRQLRTLNDEWPQEKRVQFRIGVNLGDVIVDQNEIYGDGVNVAARLQTLAEPGGVCVSDSVRTALGNKLSLKLHDLGLNEVKNIAEPVRAWQWVVDEETETFTEPHRKRAMDLTDMPTIAVMSFENLSEDHAMDSFADGITDELITAFSRQTGMKVLSRGSTLPFKRAIDIEKLGSELGVHYLLEGSVRKAGQRVRISARLVDVETGNDLWGEQYDGEVEDVFALQDELRLGIVAAARSQIHMKDAQRVRDLPESELNDGELLALASKRMQSWGVDNYREAARLLHIVNQRSPDNPMALAMSASCVLLVNGYDYKAVEPAEVDRAFALIDKSVQLNEESDYAHYVRGKLLLWLRHEHDLAMAEAERALELNPNYTYGYALLGFVVLCRGEAERGIELIDKALAADPRRAGNADFYQQIAVGQFLLEQYATAIQWSEKAAQRMGYTVPLRLALASYHALLGELDAARNQMQAALKEAPAATIGNVQTPPLKNPDDVARFQKGLSKAGLQEEPM